MLTLLAAYAEEEARSASENQMWRIQKKFAQGQSTSIDMFGYRFVKGKLEIIPEEAALIREAARQYLEGATQEKLEDIFNAAGVVGRHGKRLTGTGIINLLTNEKIVGDLLLQKTYCVDPISKECRKNRGERPQYFVEGSHDPILDRETYERILKERRRRFLELGMENRDCRRKHWPFSSKIACGCCGKHFVRRSWESKKYGTRYVWICRTRTRGNHLCGIKQIPEPILERLAAETLGISVFRPEVFLNKVEKIIIPENGKMVFLMNDGREIEKSHDFQWPDKKRGKV